MNDIKKQIIGFFIFLIVIGIVNIALPVLAYNYTFKGDIEQAKNYAIATIAFSLFNIAMYYFTHHDYDYVESVTKIHPIVLGIVATLSVVTYIELNKKSVDLQYISSLLNTLIIINVVYPTLYVLSRAYSIYLVMKKI